MKGIRTKFNYRDENLEIAENYAYLVPFVENNEDIFLKTIIPSRKATKKYSGSYKMNKLDSEEKEILEAFEKGTLKRSKNAREEIEKHKAVAKATFKKDARINIRISSRDLRLLQAKALSEGIPYQTLVSSILHKYTDGQLTEGAANKTVPWRSSIAE